MRSISRRSVLMSMAAMALFSTASLVTAGCARDAKPDAAATSQPSEKCPCGKEKSECGCEKGKGGCACGEKCGCGDNCECGKGGACGACGAKSGEMATGSEDAPVWFMAPPKPGDKATCIVTGEVFTVAKDTIVKEYQGSFSALCCEGCEKDFEAAAMANPPKASMPTPR